MDATPTTALDTVVHAHSLTRQQVKLLTAHHEAAHAVIALHHGLEVTSLEIQHHTEDGTWSIGGITYVTYLPSEASDFALQGAAGELAAIKWLDRQGLLNDETTAAANADHDRDEVLDLLAQDGIQISWPDIRKQARDEVNALWPQITAMAHVAVDKGRLTGVEILRLFASAV